jgi:hypothetical protein
MKAKRKLLLGVLCMVSSTLYAQTTELSGVIKLGPKAHAYKLITKPNCPQVVKIPPDSPTKKVTTTIKYVTKLTNDKTEITVESIVIGAKDSVKVNANKPLRIPLSPDSQGKANFYVDDKDKSVLYINYFLNSKKILNKGTVIEVLSPEYGCATPVVPVMTSRKKLTLRDDSTVFLRRVNIPVAAKNTFRNKLASKFHKNTIPPNLDVNTTWFANSEQIKVFKADGTTVDYYLVNRYDRNAKYVLELQNREHISYKHNSLDFGALTIPFKYRFGYKRGNIETKDSKNDNVKDDVVSSFNIGLYGGYKLSKYSIINKAGTYVNRNFFSLRVGPFINLSAVTLDTLNTFAGESPLGKDVKLNIAVLSSGVGLMGDVKGVQVGVYGGWDFGMGSEARNWNYNKRFWLGFGVGYKITDLFAKKD